MISQLEEAHANLSYVGRLVEDCLHLRNVFEFVNFFHDRRGANKVAHVLADLSFNPIFSFPLYWDQEVPDVISPLVTLDALN